MNLCDLPKGEQDAIQADKEAWFEAHKMLNTMNRNEIVTHLESLPEDEKEDLRRRLNTIQGNRK